jgi:hypothetical protein
MRSVRGGIQMRRRNIDFPIVIEGIAVDDVTLLKMHEALLNQIEEKERKYLDFYNQNYNQNYKNNYLHLTIARLAYGFAKEEYESVLEEMKRRGLAAS